MEDELTDATNPETTRANPSRSPTFSEAALPKKGKKVNELLRFQKWNRCIRRLHSNDALLLIRSLGIPSPLINVSLMAN